MLAAWISRGWSADHVVEFLGCFAPPRGAPARRRDSSYVAGVFRRYLFLEIFFKLNLFFFNVILSNILLFHIDLITGCRQRITNRPLKAFYSFSNYL